MENHQIILNNQTIEYTIIYKHIRSLYFKVEKGELIVKAPYHTSLSVIEDYIIKYQNKLLKRMVSYESYYDYRDNGYIDIYNQRYTIVLRDVKKNLCEIHDDKIYVYHHQIEKCLDSYLRKQLLDYITERVIYYLVNDFDLGMPKIEVRKYKGRWGSCFFKENKISFNLALIHLDKDLIDYVIVHELTHFLQANHSALFYQEMSERMPDYKNRQKRLKEKHV